MKTSTLHKFILLVIATLLEWTGHDVTREFYINDAGVQIARVAESLWARVQQAVGRPGDESHLALGCAEQHEIQHDLGRRFGLSWDHFGRSSSPQNHRLTQRFAQQLWENGFIEERVTQQVYSNADKRFLPDRYVIGTCP